ncbi:hypothetical protein WR25_25144 [Diploscapter pachys]|uniref:Protein kinase domain-containing protein n=1 Tax=Diploscapter pachys TaxID=2018661 RepID=A0A2A2LVQ1_9BILA|nr:hypothetical protein WR25_25144 [Diploscapter pachys]
MSHLYPDESYCTSDIGQLLFQPKTSWSGNCTITDSREVKTFSSTHVDYDLQIKLAPVNILQQDPRAFYLTTRYKELNRLHAGLAKLHKQLYLRGTFPTFPTPKLIGSTEPAVVEERKRATEQFLNFVLDSEVLRKSRLLQEFVEKAKERANTARSATPDAFLYESGNIMDAPITMHSSGSPSEFRQEEIPPNESTSSQPADDLPEQPEQTNQSTVIQQQEFQFPDVALDSEGNAQVLTQPRHFDMRRIFPKLSSNSQAISEQLTSSDYLVRAGHLVATAQRAEQEHAYELAFQCYKNAASSLMQGIQLESDVAKRNAVRRNTAKYLVRAERLFRNYLAYDGSAFNIDGLLNSTMQDPNILAFHCSNHALKNYRFIGVIPSVEESSRVILVEEKQTNEKFVMKLVEKEETGRIQLPTNVPHSAQLIKFFETENFIILLLVYVPTGRLWGFLQNYFDTCESRWLLSLNGDEIDAEVAKSNEQNKSFVYAGKRLRFSVGVDFERVAQMRDENQSTEDPSNSDAVVCSMGEDATGEVQAEPGDFSIVGDIAQQFSDTIIAKEESPAPVQLNTKTLPARDSEEKLAHELLEARSYLSGSSHRRKFWPSNKPLPEILIIHWSAQIVSNLYILHSEHEQFICDLQPKNILIDCNANLVLTCCVEWNSVYRRRKYVEGYSAPECFQYDYKCHSSSDVYSFGAIFFEFLTGRSLANAAPHGLARMAEIPIPEYCTISHAARNLLSLTLNIDPNLRPSLDEIRLHPLFVSIDWSLYDNPFSASLGQSQTSFESTSVQHSTTTPLTPEDLLSDI